MAARVAEVMDMMNAAQGQGLPLERRWSQRRPAVLTVEVQLLGALLATCHTRDVGMGGAFVDFAHGSIPKGMEFDLVFRLGDDRTMRHRLRAKVVRTDVDGVGVSFRDFDIGTFRSLQEILRHAPISVEEGVDEGRVA